MLIFYQTSVFCVVMNGSLKRLENKYTKITQRNLIFLKTFDFSLQLIYTENLHLQAYSSLTTPFAK